MCAIWRVRVNQDVLKLNGTHKLLVYDDSVNILEGNVHTIKKNAEAFVYASEETGLEEVNAGKTKYMTMSRDQDAGRSHSMKIDNNYFEGWKSSNIGNNLNKSKIYSGRNSEEFEVRECLLSSGAESFVFQFAIQKFKD